MCKCLQNPLPLAHRCIQFTQRELSALLIPAMLYFDVNNRALFRSPWCAAITTVSFCIQFVLDILPVYSHCISLVIWCCNILADVTSVTGGSKNAACFASSGTTRVLIWFPGAKGTVTISDILSGLPHPKEAQPGSQSWRLIVSITSAGIAHTPAEKKCRLSPFLPYLSRSVLVSRCALHMMP